MSTKSSDASSSLRFVRLNPRFDRDETLRRLKSEIKTHPNDNKKYPLPVQWLNSKENRLEFFAIPGDFSLRRSTSFQSGRVYGMDVTSGAAVAALMFDLYDSDSKPITADKQKRDHSGRSETPLRVLDLCCAPGLKLCMMADLAPPSSILEGVDISSQRISLCKNIVTKYHVDDSTSGSKLTSKPETTDLTNSSRLCNGKSNTTKSGGDENASSRTTIRLYCADGTIFGIDNKCTKQGLVFDSNAAMEEFQSRGKRKRMNKSAKAREKRRLRELQRKTECHGDTDTEKKIEETHADSKTTAPEKYDVKDTMINTCEQNKLVGSIPISSPAFDRVLVDAECSTDGAMRHIEKRQSSSSSLSRSPAWDDTNMDELVELQKRLIASGFRLLKKGGVMVYSTCSLSGKQNEDVVLWLLNNCEDAFIIPVSFPSSKESARNPSFVVEGSVPGTVRFNPGMQNMDLGHVPAEMVLSECGFFLAKIGKR